MWACTCARDVVTTAQQAHQHPNALMETSLTATIAIPKMTDARLKDMRSVSACWRRPSSDSNKSVTGMHDSLEI